MLWWLSWLSRQVVMLVLAPPPPPPRPPSSSLMSITLSLRVHARILFCILQPLFALIWIPRSTGLCESLPTEWVARQTTSVTMDSNLSVPDGGGVRPMESGLERHPLANVRNAEQGQTRRKYFHASPCNWLPTDLYYSWKQLSAL